LAAKHPPSIIFNEHIFQLFKHEFSTAIATAGKHSIPDKTWECANFADWQLDKEKHYDEAC
jgi:hypothetical protein